MGGNPFVVEKNFSGVKKVVICYGDGYHIINSIQLCYRDGKESGHYYDGTNRYPSVFCVPEDDYIRKVIIIIEAWKTLI